MATVEATLAFGSALGKCLRAGDLVILSGSLGAGKTTLTKGIAVGMGVTGRVTSPTFVIARVHRPDVHPDVHPDPDVHSAPDSVPDPQRRKAVPLVHVDAYRLAGAVELDDLDLDTDLSAAAVVVEWGEGIAEQLSIERLIIELTRLPDDTRKVTLTPVGDSWQRRLPEIVAARDQAKSYGSE